MHLVQLLLPVFDNDGVRIAESEFAAVRRDLTTRFGGVTAYVRAPAKGLWISDSGEIDRDDVVMVEVVVPELARSWWAAYRQQLAGRFRQKEILVRAIEIEPL